MKEPTHISEIIESMDIFAKEPKPLTFRRLRTKKSRSIGGRTAMKELFSSKNTVANLQ